MWQSMYGEVAMVSHPDASCDLLLRVGIFVLRKRCNGRKQEHLEEILPPNKV